MYKLILVEDEEDVREGVIQEIDWAGNGFEVVDKAENGREAMELIERLVPDIVVTDIKMPFMDGLQLSEWIRERYRHTKIVILTGFDEFEYAQRALKLHIDEYVLKPFSSQELVDVLHKVKAELDTEMAARENVQLLSEHYRKSLPVLREVFLGSLVSRTLSRAEIEEKAANYQIPLAGGTFVSAIIQMDSGHDQTAQEHSDENRGSLKDSNDTDLQWFAVYNIAEEWLAQTSLGTVFVHDGHVVLLFALRDERREAAMERTLQLLEDIRTSIEKYLKFTVTIGVGTVVHDVVQARDSFEDAKHALDYRPILGGNRIICIDDVERRSDVKLRLDELQEQTLMRCLKVGTTRELGELLDELFADVLDSPLSSKDYQIYLMELVTVILKAAKDSSVDLEALFGPSSNLFMAMYKLGNVAEAKQWMLNMCLKLMGSIASERQSSYKQLVEEAKEYSKAHFHESDISIHKVCAHLYISAGYFSSIFKKETRMTFVQYLLHIRMEAAKELLRATDLRTFEVGEKVGYADANYFSFCFKKYVGLSPKEYRGDPREA